MKNKINKIATVIFIAGLLLLTLILVSGVKSKTSTSTENICLEFSGTIKGNANPIKEIHTVKLIEEDVVIDSMQITTNQTFRFNLERNKQYSIKVSCPEKFDKLICISTQLFKTVKSAIVNKLHFNINGESNCKWADGTADLPTAIICYDSKKGHFDYNKKYTDFIKRAYKLAKK